MRANQLYCAIAGISLVAVGLTLTSSDFINETVIVIGTVATIIAAFYTVLVEAAYRSGIVAKDQDMELVSDTITLRVVVFQDSGQWVAQCLEHDIGAQASDIDTLNDRLRVVLLSEFKESVARNGVPFGGIEPAPERFQLMWERRARSVDVRPAAWMVGNTRPQFGLVA